MIISAYLAALLVHCALGAEAPATRLVSSLVEAAVRSGQDAKLPPHLSVVLGISVIEASTPVRQLAFKNGDDIKTLNVCAVERHCVVLMSVSTSNRVTAYLMSTSGVLRKAVVYHVGGETREVRNAEAKREFLQERELWLERAAALGLRP